MSLTHEHICVSLPADRHCCSLVQAAPQSLINLQKYLCQPLLLSLQCLLVSLQTSASDNSTPSLSKYITSSCSKALAALVVAAITIATEVMLQDKA